MSDENANIPPEGTVQTVRAFIACFLPDLVVGLQEEDGLWHLPGGIVEGVGCPEELPQMQGGHLAPLRWYVEEQTGLMLTSLTEAFQVTMVPVRRGFEVTILYAGQATGSLLRGVKLDPKKLPRFVPECGDPYELVEKIIEQHPGEGGISKRDSIGARIGRLFQRKGS